MPERPFPLILGVAGLALHAATWRLWTAQSLFPQVPLIEAARDWPGWIDGVAFAAIVAGYVGIAAAAFRPALTRAAVPLLVVGYVVAVLGDQNRLQVWVWHFALVAAVLAMADPRFLLYRLQVLTGSIYLWSAISKLNRAFVDSIGPMLLEDGLLTAIGVDVGGIRINDGISLALPLSEAAIGVAVLSPVWRAGLLLSIAMHGALLLTVGPLGLGHTAGVLLWNAYFMAQNGTLAVSHSTYFDDVMPRFEANDRGALAVVVVGAAVPALMVFDLVTPWVGWAVYAPVGTQVAFNYGADPDNLDFNLPEPREHLPIDFGESPRRGGHVGRFEAWSAATVGVPLSPGEAVRIGVAIAAAERAEQRPRETGRAAVFEATVTRYAAPHAVLPVKANVLKNRLVTKSDWFRKYAGVGWMNMLPRRTQNLDWERIAEFRDRAVPEEE